MGNSQKERPLPAALKVKYKNASVEDFIEHSGKDISLLGVFIKTKKPMEEGVPLKFELQLADGTPVIRGVGQVAWRRETAQSDDQPAGMGIKFIKLDSMSQAIVNRALKARGFAPSRYDRQDETDAVPRLAPQEEAVAAPTRTSVAPVRIPTAIEERREKAKRDFGEFVAATRSERPPEPSGAEQPPAEPEAAKQPPKSLEEELFSDLDSALDKMGKSTPVPSAVTSAATPARLDRSAAERAATAGRQSHPLGVFENAPRVSIQTRREEKGKAAGGLFGANAEEEASQAEGSGGSKPLPAEPFARREVGPRSTPIPISRISPTPAAPVSPAPVTPAVSTPAASVSAAAAKAGAHSLAIIAALAALTCVALGASWYFFMRGKGAPPKGPASLATATRSSASGARRVAADNERVEPSPAPAPQEPAKPLPTTEVSVTSTPSSAQVTVDGNPAGETPVKLRLPVGKAMTITAKAPGFEMMAKEITAQPANPAISFKLNPLQYMLSVNSEPAGAEVNTRSRMGISPVEINVGIVDEPFAVTVDKQGFQRLALQVRPDQFVEKNGFMRAEVSVTLTPLPAAGPVETEHRASSRPRAPRPKASAPAAPAAAPVEKPKPAAQEAPKPAAPKAELPENPF